MKIGRYCISHDNTLLDNFKYWDELDEIRYEYNSANIEFPNKVKLCKEKYPNLNILLMIKPEHLAEMGLFTSLYNQYENITLGFYWDMALVQFCQRNKLPFIFLDEVDDWDILRGLAQYKPVEMYITNALAFAIKDVYEVLSPLGIGIRIYPDVAQVSTDLLPVEEEFCKFFVRPEDITIYADYVSTFELFHVKGLNVFFDVYFHKHFWWGQLNELIANLNQPVYSQTIVSSFAPTRLNCGKRCSINKNCSLCKKVLDLAETLSKENLIFYDK